MKRVGLFIGVDLYADRGIPQLNCAGNDAVYLRDCFKSLRFDDVSLLLDGKATVSAIRDQVRDICGELSYGDLFVLYFAGHGVEFAGKHYLLGSDADSVPGTTAGKIPTSDLICYSNKEGLNRLFILDCCRTDLIPGRGAAYACPDTRNISLGQDLKWAQAPGKVIQPLILNSCATGQRSHEDVRKKRGIFTWALQSVLEDAENPVRDLDSMIRRVNLVMKDQIPPPEQQFLDFCGNPYEWDTPLFAAWEKKAAAPSPAPRRQPSPEPAADAPVQKADAPTAKERPTDADALFRLGSRYYNGDGVPQNYEEAAECFRQAAEQGHFKALENLRMCYFFGHGVPQDYNKALYWTPCADRKDAPPPAAPVKKADTPAAGKNQTDADALFRLGSCYYNGDGVPQNYEEAAKCFRKAAEQGHVEAQYILGWCLANGEGVQQDYGEAVKWFRKAAEQGHGEAQTELDSLKRFLRTEFQ